MNKHAIKILSVLLFYVTVTSTSSLSVANPFKHLPQSISFVKIRKYIVCKYKDITIFIVKSF